jgi:hypothetical protein
MMCHDKFTLLMLHKNGAACLVGAGAESTSMKMSVRPVVCSYNCARITCLVFFFSLETTNL